MVLYFDFTNQMLIFGDCWSSVAAIVAAIRVSAWKSHKLLDMNDLITLLVHWQIDYLAINDSWSPASELLYYLYVFTDWWTRCHQVQLIDFLILSFVDLKIPWMACFAIPTIKLYSYSFADGVWNDRPLWYCDHLMYRTR